MSRKKTKPGQQQVTELNRGEMDKPMKILQNQTGKVGWILLWALGVPLPILGLLFLMRGCT